MTTLAYTIAGLVILGCAVFVYAACVMAGRADEQFERLWRDLHEGEDDV